MAPALQISGGAPLNASTHGQTPALRHPDTASIFSNPLAQETLHGMARWRFPAELCLWVVTPAGLLVCLLRFALPSRAAACMQSQHSDRVCDQKRRTLQGSAPEFMRITVGSAVVQDR